MCSTRVSSSNSCVRGKRQRSAYYVYCMCIMHPTNCSSPPLSLPKISSSYRTLDHLHSPTLTFTIPPSPSQTLTLTIPPSPSQSHPHLHNPTLTFTDHSLTFTIPPSPSQITPSPSQSHPHLHNPTLTFTVPPSPSQSHPHLHNPTLTFTDHSLTFTIPPSPSQSHPHLHNPTLTFTDNSLAVDPLAAHIAPFLPVERHWLRPLMGDGILWGEGGVRGGGGR